MGNKWLIQIQIAKCVKRKAEKGYFLPTPSINNNHEGGISDHWRKGGITQCKYWDKQVATEEK